MPPVRDCPTLGRYYPLQCRAQSILADIAPTSNPAPTQGGEERTNGTNHCDLYSVTGRCDVCQHKVESYVQSEFYSGRNIHTKATDKKHLRWFVYLEEDLNTKKNRNSISLRIDTLCDSLVKITP